MDSAGRICCWPVLLVIIVALWWAGPYAVALGAVGTSTNKADGLLEFGVWLLLFDPIVAVTEDGVRWRDLELLRGFLLQVEERGLKERDGGPGAGLRSAGEGSVCLRCGRPDPEQVELGATRRLMRLHRQDPPRRRWCFLQLINVMWLGVLLLRRIGVVGVLLLVVDLFFFASRGCVFLCVVCVLPCSSL